MAEPVLVVEDVHKTYPARREDVRALAGVSFRVAPGEAVALMGDNGAGKSTLLDLVCGLTTPTSGGVTVLGQSPRRAVRAGRVGAMLQTGGLLPDLTVAETVRLVASISGRPEAAEEALASAGLGDITDRRIAVCSGGEQQRVKFALALLPRAHFLVLDEPTAGMDWHARAAFWASMRAFTRAGGTLLYSTHYADEVVDIAGRVVVLSAGRVVADTSVAAIAAATGRRRIEGRLAARPDAVAALRRDEGVPSVEVDGGRVTLDVGTDHVNEVLGRLIAHGVEDLRVVDPPFFASLDALVRAGREPA